jgi:hypothetical protein
MNARFESAASNEVAAREPKREKERRERQRERERERERERQRGGIHDGWRERRGWQAGGKPGENRCNRERLVRG